MKTPEEIEEACHKLAMMLMTGIPKTAGQEAVIAGMLNALCWASGCPYDECSAITDLLAGKPLWPPSDNN